ncbi:hypothetical protein ACFO3D_08355 [Virgibacillus kekensis]|uniref:Uncharacterized protein n=1 Tax=Virgibacillus kekensis TaxID=202261 RepID=A0ABV9DK69_9BACI
MRESKRSIERGQSITFRVPSDTPDYLLKQLQKLKETERRNFSSVIAQYVLRGVNESFSRDRETLTIPLPRQLTKEQKSWLKHEHSEALIGSILYQLLQDPMRATTLMASMNNNGYEIMQDLDLDDEDERAPEPENEKFNEKFDLDSLDLGELDTLHEGKEEPETEPEDDDPLGDFFAKMNK